MSDTSWNLYASTEPAWQAMYDDCERAKKSIDCEMFIFGLDTIGRKFIDLFLRKAKEGIKVRLLLDAVGSYYFYISAVPDELRRAGIEVRFFNPVSPWRIRNFTSNFFRTHRKLLIIDNEIGHTGGVNFRDDMCKWRDTNMRFTGDLVAELEQVFLRMWVITWTGKFSPFSKPAVYVKNFALRTNAPHFRQRFIYNEMIGMIRNAKKYVYLTTPYFVPDLRFLRVVRLAAKRGVDVRLLVPEVTDHYIVGLAGESHYTLLLKAGVKIFRYKPCMLHAKTIAVDGAWATVGSFNLDSLSFLFNYELNVVSDDPVFADAVAFQFHSDCAESSEVVKEAWFKRSLFQKTMEVLSWPMHKFL